MVKISNSNPVFKRNGVNFQLYTGNQLVEKLT